MHANAHASAHAAPMHACAKVHACALRFRSFGLRMHIHVGGVRVYHMVRVNLWPGRHQQGLGTKSGGCTIAQMRLLRVFTNQAC